MTYPVTKDVDPVIPTVMADRDGVVIAALGGAVDFPAGALEAVRASMARVRS